MVKGGREGLGVKGIMKDMGYEVGIEMRTDASAAIGIVNRRGLGKVKHIELNTLWMQNQVYRGVFKIVKVRTDENLADAMTKPVDGGGLLRHVEGVGCWIAQGRHREMPELDAEKSEGENDWDEEVHEDEEGEPRGRHGGLASQEQH